MTKIWYCLFLAEKEKKTWLFTFLVCFKYRLSKFPVKKITLIYTLPVYKLNILLFAMWKKRITRYYQYVMVYPSSWIYCWSFLNINRVWVQCQWSHSVEELSLEKCCFLSRINIKANVLRICQIWITPHKHVRRPGLKCKVIVRLKGIQRRLSKIIKRVKDWRDWRN